MRRQSIEQAKIIKQSENSIPTVKKVKKEKISKGKRELFFFNSDRNAPTLQNNNIPNR